MAHLILPSRFNQQPQGAVELNPQHWLAADLLFIHSGKQGFVNGSPVAPILDTALRGVRTGTNNAAIKPAIGFVPDGSGYVSYEIPPTAAPLTLSAWHHGGAGTTSDTIISVAQNGANTGANLTRNNLESILLASVVSGASSSAVATSGYVAGKWRHGVGIAFADNTRGCYEDGGSYVSNATSRNIGSSINRVNLQANAALTIASSVISNIMLPLVIRRALNADEVLRLFLEQTNNPWKIFKKRPNILYFDVGGGGGATLIAANDTLTPSLTESQASLINSSVTDGLTPSLSEVSALLKNPEFVTVTDTLSVSVTEALALLATSIVTDTLAPGLTESATVNTGGAPTEVAVTDTLAPGVTEATATLAQLLASEGLTPTLTEAQTSLVYSGVSEALELVLGEVQGSLVFSTVTEAFSISVSESVALLVAHTATDTLLVSITDTSGLVSADVIAKEVSEALAPYFTELGTLELLDAWQHASQVVGVWTLGAAGSGAWNAETPISGTWTEDPPL